MSDRLSQASLLAAGLLFGLLLGRGPTPALAQQAGGQQMFAVTAPGQAQGSNVLFVIDPESLRLAVYEHRVGGKLELKAVRNVAWELRYEQWPAPDAKAATGTEPDVRDVKKQVERPTPPGGG